MASMLKFAGNGDYTAVNIRIYGDGIANEIMIDLSKAPFNLNWGTGGNSFYPKSLDLADIGGTPAPSEVTMSGSVLHVVFDTPPPAADFSKTPDPYPSPRVAFTVNFIYGSAITGVTQQPS